MQLPLPAHMDETKVTYAVSPAKDVDGFHPVNAGNLYLGTPIHVPATPSGCMELLRAYDVDPAGKEAVVIGRSEIVGRPMAMLLLHAHATVTICHSRTADLASHVRRADIVVAAVGRPGSSPPTWSSPAPPVSTSAYTHRRGHPRRHRPGVEEVAGFLTPMPGGTGPMTIAMLLAIALEGGALPSRTACFPWKLTVPFAPLR